jgi:hypothetical protein
MGYDLTVQGLLRKRAEMAGQVEAIRGQLGGLIVDLSHIDAAIRVFRPDIELDDLPEGSVPAPFTGFRGEIVRFILDLLRNANGSLDTFQIAEHVMVKRGLDPADRMHFKLIAKRTGYALAKLRKAGKVTSQRAHRSAPLQWTVANV